MGELSSGPDPELAVHVAKVVLHGRRTDEHLGGDVLVGSTWMPWQCDGTEIGPGQCGKCANEPQSFKGRHNDRSLSLPSRAGTGSGHSDGRNRTVTLQKTISLRRQAIHYALSSKGRDLPATQERSHGRD